MKRLLFFICTLLCANVLFAQTFWLDSLQYNVTSTNQVEVYDANSSIITANIPTTVTYQGITYSVTSIGYIAFNNCSSLTSVTIPNSVTSIGDEAFRNCSSLTSVTIPNSVTEIVGFLGCSSLTSITIPNSVNSIGDWAFCGCSGLTSVTIPNSVTSIGDGAFLGCSSLTSVTIPNSVTSIDQLTFRNCSSLTSVTIPNSVTSIGSGAFWDCSSLPSVTIPNSVTEIESEAFYGCSSLTSVTIPNSVTSIGNATFYDCSSLTSVTLPENITSIGDYTFLNCISLTSIDIPDSVTSIGYSAFNNCSSLTSVTIPNSVTYIGYRAFNNCSSLTILNYNAINCNNFDSYDDDVDYEYYYYQFAYCPITTINIGNSVQRIPNDFAYNLDSLTSVTIGNSVTSIGGGAFYGCSSLTYVNIPNSVTSIGYKAFYECSSLTSVTIGNSVTSIGYKAFYNCSSLTTLNYNAINCNFYIYDEDDYYEYQFAYCPITTINIGDSVQRIPSYFAYNLDSLTSVTIGNSVTSIRSSAFYNCSSLDSITCLADIPPALGNNVFNNTPSNKILYVNCGLKDDYISSWGDYFNSNNIQEIYQYNVVATINNEAFGSVAVENNCYTATLTATANNCYQFVRWNDGNTENPRVVSLLSDTSLTAIFENLNTELIVNICEDQVYNENGFNVSEAGVYTQTLTSANGCDSIVTLTLNVNPTFNTELSATICQGQVYNENGFNVSEAGVYTQTLTSANGCDSIVTLTLNVNPTFDTTINATINAGETYAEFGFNESEAGTYVQNLQTEAGCDSTITLVLSVNSSLIDIEETEITFYPNPTDSKITFSQKIEKIEVIDLIGKTIFTFTNAKTINIESLPSGAYYLRLTNEEKTTMQKVIKQ